MSDHYGLCGCRIKPVIVGTGQGQVHWLTSLDKLMLFGYGEEILSQSMKVEKQRHGLAGKGT